MRKSKGQGHLKLLISAINILEERSLISWSPIHLLPPQHGCIIVDLAGEPTAIIWHDAGYGELSISVWWKFDYDAYIRRGPMIANFATTLPAASRKRYPKFVGATASVWFERKEGRFIQGTPAQLFDVYTQKALEEKLDALPWEEPQGFKISGDYYL